MRSTEKMNYGAVLKANRRYRARFNLIEIWLYQLTQYPHGEITRPQVAATLRAFLDFDPEQEAA